MTMTDKAGHLPGPRTKMLFSRWKRSLLVAGLLAGGIAIAANSLPLAATEMGHSGWRHGPRLEFIQRFVTGALDSVGATAAQEAKVHDIIAANFGTITPDPSERDALRKQILDLLRAPTVDRAAIERLRAAQIAAIDAKSKKLVDAALQVADLLTPEQRAKLAERAEAMAQRGPHFGPHDGPGDGHGHSPRDDGHGPDEGDAPAPNPDKG